LRFWRVCPEKGKITRLARCGRALSPLQRSQRLFPEGQGFPEFPENFKKKFEFSLTRAFRTDIIFLTGSPAVNIYAVKETFLKGGYSLPDVFGGF
jgi:hypothetical protein